jgi:transcriptional regulator with XRE-family HTH domain
MELTKIIARLRRECEKAGSQQAFADNIGVSRPYVTLVLSGRSPPSRKMLNAIGMERVVVFRKIVS